MKECCSVCCNFLLLLLYIISVEPLFCFANTSSNPPNIILIVADDLGYNDVGFHGSEIYTPCLDELAQSGVSLENYYVQPSCTPSRGQLLTGRYGIHTGLLLNIQPLEPLCLPLDEVTLAQKLKEQNYKTHMLGKWHLGHYRKECTPTHRGFDSFYGIHLGSGDHYSHWKTKYNNRYSPSGYDFWRNENVSWSEGRFYGYSTALYRDEALKIVSNHDPKDPLFIYLSFQAPHGPLQVPQSWLPHYGHIRDTKRRKFAGMVTALDSSVGELVESLKERGLWDNTVLVFTTDNGGQIVNGGNNWPLRGGKGSLWEGGIRGVAFVNSPLLTLPGRASKRLMHVTDWFPTLIGLSGGNLNGSKPLDGFDQWESISGNKKSPRKEILHNIKPTMMRNRNKLSRHHPYCWKYLPIARLACRRQDVSNPLTMCAQEYRQNSCFEYNNGLWCSRAAIRRGRWKLLVGAQKPGNWIASPSDKTWCSTLEKNKKLIQLYNIKTDPLEKTDVSKKYPNKVAKLMARLEKYRRSSVPHLKAEDDIRGLPRLHGGVWGPWPQHFSNLVI